MISCSSAPTSPASTRARTSAKLGSKRRLKPSMMGTVWPLICSWQARTVSMSRSMGFSHSTASPWAAARVMRSTWVGVGEPMMTPSRPGSAKTSAGSCTARAPVCAARRWAASMKGSAIRTRSMSGWEATLRAWTCPIRPEPNRARRRRRSLDMVCPFVKESLAGVWAAGQGRARVLGAGGPAPSNGRRRRHALRGSCPDRAASPSGCGERGTDRAGPGQIFWRAWEKELKAVSWA